MRRSLVIAIALNAGAVALGAAWVHRVESAYAHFRGAGSFGFSTAPSADESLGFQMLLRDPRATRLFENLAREGTPAAQLYALCGLFHSDRAAHHDLKRRLDVRHDGVTFRGCLEYERPLRAVAKWDGTSTERTCGPMRLSAATWLALQTQETWNGLTRR